MNRSWLSLTLLLTALGLITFPATAQPTTTDGSDYRLVYRHDGQGQKIEGDLGMLRRAVRAGLEIRVGWAHQHPQQPKISVEHVADASFLTIMSGEHVMAQIEVINGQAPDFKSGLMHFRPDQTWRMIASTRGQMVSQMSNPDGSAGEERISPQGYSWFVRGRIPQQMEPLWDAVPETSDKP